MVKTNRRRCNKFHGTAFQQFTVTMGACTDNQNIGIFYIPRRKSSTRQIYHLIGYLPDSFFNIGDFIVYNYFHLLKKLGLGQR